MSKSRLQDLLALSTVPRWSIVPHTRPQSVAEHSFRVAAIAMEISRKLNHNSPSSSVVELNILRWSVVHDGPEAETGDVPYPVKQELPPNCMDVVEHVTCPWYAEERYRIHPPERAICKIADKIEEVLFLGEWGTGPKAAAAMESARRQIRDHMKEARARYGWADLPRIVDEIFRSSGQSYFAVQLPLPDQPSPVSPEPSAAPPVRLPILPVVRPPED